MSRADELRRLADQYEVIEELEATVALAKDTYREQRDDRAAKDAFQAAKEALRSARQELRESGLLVGDSTPGSVTIAPQGVAGKAG